MANKVNDNVDYRLLDRLSNLVICSSCFQSGVVKPVPQVISDRHFLQNVCNECRAAEDASGAAECDNGQPWPSCISTIRR
jgi:hypothetical protein